MKLKVVKDEPRKELVELAERLLEEVRTGQVTDFCAIARKKDGTYLESSHLLPENNIWMIGAIQVYSNMIQLGLNLEAVD